MIPRLPFLSLCLGLLVVPGLAQARDSQGEPGRQTPLAGHSGALRAAVLEPGAPLELPLDDPGAAAWVPIAGTAGLALEAQSDDGTLRAPASPGCWRLEERGLPRLIALVPVASSELRGGRLNGYRIGHYPRGKGAFAPPRGFLEVSAQAAELPVSAHFKLGEFLTKGQTDVWPKYLVLDLGLVDKLELVLQRLQADGLPASGLHVMSGYRTPSYNGPGGQGRARNSRHLYGDAADLWLDEDGDGQMDDLDGDGRIAQADARVILEAVEQVEQQHPELVGGAGTYPATREHGPFIHVDRRGRPARW